MPSHNSSLSESGSETASTALGYGVRSQLDLLIFLVALIGVGATLGQLAAILVGFICAGIAVITLGRMYRREF